MERDSPKWLKSINSADGSAVVNPGHLVLAGDYTVQVRVTFPDTTTEIVPMTVTVPPFPQRASNDQCLAAGLPLLLLIPVGLATELNIPGLSPIIDEIERQAAQVNAQFQQQAGIYNPEVARFVEQYNDEIRAAALVAAGLLVVSYLAASCSPDGSSTSSTSGDLSSTGSDDSLSSLSSLSSE